MPRPTPSRLPFLIWAQANLYLLIAVPLFVGLGLAFLLRSQSEWDDVYLRAANHLLAGESPYHRHEGYVYPPFQALASIPFALLPAVHGRLAWYLVNVACLVVLVTGAWRLAGGRALSATHHWAFGDHAALLLGLACGFRYALDALAHQQTDLVVGALVVGGCLALSGNRPAWAATWFGLAAAMKCTPLLWALYLIGRRQWGAALWLCGVAGGANLLVDVVHQPPEGGTWLGVWLTDYLLPLGESTHYPGIWYSGVNYNQSLSGAIFRWSVTWPEATATGWQLVERSGAPGALILQLLTYPLEIMLLLGAAWVVARRRVKNRAGFFASFASLRLCAHSIECAQRRKDAKDAKKNQACRDLPEYSLVVLLMLLLSPMSSKPHFCTMLLPGFCLAQAAIHHRNRFLGLFLLGAIATGTAGIRDLWGADVAAVALWLGNVTWSAGFLLVGCVYMLLNDSTFPTRSSRGFPMSARQLVLSPAVLLLLCASPVPAQVPIGDPSAAKKAMAKLDWWAGDWKGGGWFEILPGRKVNFTGTEKVQRKLGGLVLMIEGSHKGKLGGPEEINVHEALGVISYDGKEKKYRFHTHTADGQYSDAHLTVTDTGFIWGFQEPIRGGELRFTATRDGNDKWDEIGELSQDGGKTWRKFFSMSMQRVKQAEAK